MFRTALRVFFIAWLVMPVVAGLGGSLLAAAGPTTVEVLTVDGTIVPVIADYVDRGISQAEENGASVCIIELDKDHSLSAQLLQNLGQVVRRYFRGFGNLVDRPGLVVLHGEIRNGT